MFETKSPTVLDQLRAAYVKSLPDKLTAISGALAKRDFAAIARLGHQLKGSGLSYGFPQISEFGVRLEEAAENRRVIIIEALHVELENMMAVFTENPSHTEQM